MAKTTTVLATLCANVPLGIYKDTAFARLFGCATLPSGIPSQIAMIPRTPISTYTAFLFRDAITIYTSFTLPGTISSYIPDQTLSHPQSKVMMAQLVVPALGQVLNTPIHLIGLEFFNKQGFAKMSEMCLIVRRDFVTAAVTRMCRIIPAFGFGTFTNNEVRCLLNSKV